MKTMMPLENQSEEFLDSLMKKRQRADALQDACASNERQNFRQVLECGSPLRFPRRDQLCGSDEPAGAALGVSAAGVSSGFAASLAGCVTAATSSATESMSGFDGAGSVGDGTVSADAAAASVVAATSPVTGVSAAPSFGFFSGFGGLGAGFLAVSNLPSANSITWPWWISQCKSEMTAVCSALGSEAAGRPVPVRRGFRGALAGSARRFGNSRRRNFNHRLRRGFGRRRQRIQQLPARGLRSAR